MSCTRSSVWKSIHSTIFHLKMWFFKISLKTCCTLHFIINLFIIFITWSSKVTIHWNIFCTISVLIFWHIEFSILFLQNETSCTVWCFAGQADTHEFQAETRKLLDIVAKSLYSEKEVSTCTFSYKSVPL